MRYPPRDMTRLPAAVFLALGALYFLVATAGLTRTSETALVDGSMGLVPGVLGGVAALLVRRNLRKAITFGLLVAVGAAVSLVVFFQVLWPLL